MKYCIIALCCSVILGISGCSAVHQNEYVWVKDHEKMRLIEEANRSSAMANNVHWVNPPMKRVHRSELKKDPQQN